MTLVIIANEETEMELVDSQAIHTKFFEWDKNKITTPTQEKLKIIRNNNVTK